jgi:hypothetical protein
MLMLLGVKLEVAWNLQQLRSFAPLISFAVPTRLFPKMLMPAVSLILAVPLVLLLVAVTVYGPPAVLPAVNKPLESIVPPPFTLQVKVG